MADERVRLSSFRPYLTPFAQRIKSFWFKTSKPYEHITTEPPPGVEITANQDLNQIDTSGTFDWQFTISQEASKERLSFVILMFSSECFESYCRSKTFRLHRVRGDGHRIGKMNELEWHLNEDYKLRPPKRYVMEIWFNANDPAVYRSDVIFKFGGWPAVLRRLCVNYTAPEKVHEFDRLKRETFSLVYNISTRWGWEALSSAREEKDDYDYLAVMSRIYPFPDEKTFSVAHGDERLTRENYRGRLHEIISLEEIARNRAISRYGETNATMCLEARYEVNGELGKRQNVAPPGELFAKLLLTRKLHDSRNSYLILNECRNVLLHLYDDEGDDVFKVPIVEKGANAIYLRLGKLCVATWNLMANTSKDVRMQFVLDRRNICKWHWAVDSLENLQNLLPEKRHIEPPRFDLDVRDVFRCSSQQKTAINAIACPKSLSPMPIVVNGAFGSGKKYVITCSIRRIAQQNCTILLCTRSNALADLYIANFHNMYKKFNNTRLKPIRIYDKNCASTEVDPIVLEYCLRDSENRFCEPDAKDLKKYSLIVTTLTTSMCLVDLHPPITHLIIEEAGTIAEWEALIPLVLANESTRVIYVGDRLSRPVVFHDRRYGSESILNRLYNDDAYDGPERHPCRVDLTHVYRTHPTIVKYLGEIGYKDGIEIGRTESPRVYENTMMFYAVFGIEEEQENGMEETIGYKNEREAEELANRILEVKNAWPAHFGLLTKKSIGVFTHSTAQVYKLRSKLRDYDINDVTVENVCNARRRSYSVVFISTLGSHRSRTPSVIEEKHRYEDGFLSEPYFMYATMSLANERVVVVGDPIALLTRSNDICQYCWKKYLNKAELYGINLEALQSYLKDIPDEIPESDVIKNTLIFRNKPIY